MADTLDHVPVMLAEVVQLLSPRDGALYVDATFGGGGYTQAILNAAPCRVVAIDRDRDALSRAQDLKQRAGDRLTLLHGCFGDMAALLAEASVGRVDGIALDLGVSSAQLDDPARGFSFQGEGPLDMRMDRDAQPTAADVVNSAGEGELAHILATYGEERAARRIAAAIIKARAERPIVGTGQLASIVRAVLPRGDQGIDPATRTFQALRIVVNDELGELDRGLDATEHLLAPGGRLVVVSFHSLEDRRVKAFLRACCGLEPRPSRHQPIVEGATPAPTFRLLTRRALRPAAAEIAGNPRARSARVRAAERTEASPRSGRSVERRAA
ncbi:MAG: 16S rRNA (cytosine(1402)-N(4))-methyltransferase RsmH [Defluviicoccus sp.]|nr:16S rRNA (cytosine(1402)-N(4))-methyltransferase RsmH [Defluviicoccus sp.]MDG4591614.1 16S rRNA (cytosine(1402)-N(4))-methyltransferase RsmH [Defluviicoccus sp.]MDS4012379.1 16S rRNA (cytosine(1402)-N(4))-methyltransferase RsmH [Defluviicoccus sp.]MDS4073161.1 16S rRNA (cytosine(1402)-N(4))-methyltransferase RsmH [Defluviicoccus sp.]